jgi:hypothetical protein
MNTSTAELNISGPAAERFDPELADGGLPPAVGVQSFQVFRASRDVPAQTDGVGWTYHHHVDMACWKGQLYVAWNSCRQDEDVWPSREFFSTSTDGKTWKPPAELFPQGISTPLRIYFYRSSNDRMLVIAGKRLDQADTDEDKKGALVVREIFADHVLGDVFTLQSDATGLSKAAGLPAEQPAMYHRSDSPQFKDACAQLLADRTFLEQQDRGKLLGDRKMKWHESSAWPTGIVPGDSQKWVSGKAYSFFQRPDGVWVGISKMGWTTYSHDNGSTWAQPSVPPTLITGKAKVWSQQTADGRFALVYNPSRSNRYPLVAVASDDGVNFQGMCLVHGEMPIQRYVGLHRSIGPQYVRGISHWANDGSRSENVMWLVYSMNKEDIWVSRVPLPLTCDATPGNKPAWNLYSPKWSSIHEEDDVLEISHSDPYDYAQATRIFPESSRVAVDFELSVNDAQRAHLEIDLLTRFGSHRPVRILISPESSKIPVRSGEVVLFRLEAGTANRTYSLLMNGKPVLRDEPFAEPADRLHRITFRTGKHRGIGGLHPVAPGTDRPLNPVVYRLDNLSVQTFD